MEKTKNLLNKKAILFSLIGLLFVLGALAGLTSAVYAGYFVVESPEYKATESEIATKETELSNIDSQVKTKEEELTKTSASIEEKSAQINLNNTSIPSLEKEISGFDAQISSKAFEVNKAKVEYNDYLVTKMIIQRGPEAILLYGITISLSQCEQKIASSKATYDQKQAEYNQLVASKNTKQTQLNDLKSQNTTLSSEITGLNSQKTSIEGTVLGLQTQSDDLKASEEELKSSLESKMHWTKKLQNQLQNIF